jgi:1,3-beta-glucanosyltransferase GAS5
MAEYMNCGSDDERSDFFAFNDYSWCDPSSFTQSGWDQKVKNFTGYGLPLFLSEYGCNTNQRKFEEVSSLYSTDMTGVYSGGLVYEYSQEPNKYGLVEISGNSVTELDDFTALQSAFKNTPNPSGDGGYNQTGGASGCPAYNPPNWDVQDDSLPAIPQGAVKYMSSGAGTGPGLNGAGSQNAGGASSGTATAGSGQPTRTGTSGGTNTASGSATSSGAATGLRVSHELALAPFVCVAVAVLSSMVGASLL